MRLALLLLAAPTLALAQVQPRAMIPNVPPIQGPDCTADALTRALNGHGAGLPDHYLPGVSGIAFLATTCTDRCLCRDFREVYVRARSVVGRLGWRVVYFDQSAPPGSPWDAMRRSIEKGIPVVGFNACGDFEDVPLVGYDLEKDQIWAMAPDGAAEPKAFSLSGWQGEPVTGYVVEGRSEAAPDPRAFERDQLVEAVGELERPLIEGG